MKTGRDRISPFSQHSTCSSESFEEPETYDDDQTPHGRRSGYSGHTTSDSDNGGTPRSREHGMVDDGDGLTQERLLEHIKNTINSMGGAPHRRHASPGSSQGGQGGPPSNFRQATGMLSSGPVVPTKAAASNAVTAAPLAVGFQPKTRSQRPKRSPTSSPKHPATPNSGGTPTRTPSGVAGVPLAGRTRRSSSGSGRPHSIPGGSAPSPGPGAQGPGQAQVAWSVDSARKDASPDAEGQ